MDSTLCWSPNLWREGFIVSQGILSFTFHSTLTFWLTCHIKYCFGWSSTKTLQSNQNEDFAFYPRAYLEIKLGSMLFFSFLFCLFGSFGGLNHLCVVMETAVSWGFLILWNYQIRKVLDYYFTVRLVEWSTDNNNLEVSTISNKLILTWNSCFYIANCVQVRTPFVFLFTDVIEKSMQYH